MNEFAYLADLDRADNADLDRADNADLMRLSMRLATTPCGPLFQRHVSPDRELAALIVGLQQTRTTRLGA